MGPERMVFGSGPGPLPTYLTIEEMERDGRLTRGVQYGFANNGDGVPPQIPLKSPPVANPVNI